MSEELVVTNGGAIAALGTDAEIVLNGGGEPMSNATRAEVDIQITTAKAYPRSIHAFKQQALDLATFDEEIAAGCMYALPRGGKPIEGPSVRLAEIIASAWGNLRTEARVVGADNQEITAEATCWDLQSNLAMRVQVKRRITDKNGRRFNPDMITVTGNAAVSIALRNAIFRVIPKAYVNSLYHAARQVAIGNAETLAAKRAQMVDYFGKMGVTPERLFEAIGKKGIDDIGLDELAVLKGTASAIKNGELSVDEAFPVSVPADNGAKGVEGVKAKLTAAKDAETETTAVTDAGDTVDTATGEVIAEATTIDADELDPATEDLRTEVEGLFATFDKSRQKDLIAGKPTIGRMSKDELEEFKAFLEGQA